MIWISVYGVGVVLFLFLGGMLGVPFEEGVPAFIVIIWPIMLFAGLAFFLGYVPVFLGKKTAKLFNRTPAHAKGKLADALEKMEGE